MPGWETLIAAAGGLAVGAGLVVIWARGRLSRVRRERVETDARLRRVVIPVLERRADVLGIPPAHRGDEADGALGLVLALGQAIKHQEESAELPFGDTVEVDRKQLDTTAPGKKRPGQSRETA